MIRRIVVGSDGSPHAQRAVAFAAELAHQLRAEVLLVHATGNSLVQAIKNASCESADSDNSVERLVRTEWARPLIAARVPWGVDVRFGWAPDVLARAASDVGAQVIIVGAGSQDGTRDAASSVAAALSVRSVVPLVVVPDETESIELYAVERSTAATRS